jgi:protein-disulfide isomerase
MSNWKGARSRLTSCAVLCLVAAGASACNGDREALNELRDQQRLILAKLTTLEEKLAQRPERPPRRPPAARQGPDPTRTYDLPVGQSPVKGPADAPITIVEFSDYQCPFCARMEPLVHDALAAYPQQARLVFKHLPLVSIHPQAMPAALAATAAERQGRFWEMHELLFANQRALAPEQITEYARGLGLDMAKFQADMASDEVQAIVKEDMALAQRVGVRGTPTIFVNGRLLQQRSLDGFRQLIEPILKAEAAPTPAAGG